MNYKNFLHTATRRFPVLSLYTLFAVLFAVPFALPAHAGLIDELRAKISGRETEIEKLEQEIAEYQIQLDKTSEEANSLNKEVKTIDITRKKLSASIHVTENQIYSSGLSIEKLELEIAKKEGEIAAHLETIKETLRSIQKIEELSLAELALSSQNISVFWDDVESFQRFQKSMGESVAELKELKEELAGKKREEEEERNNLVSYKLTLSDQKTIADNERYKKDKLLKQTKNKEQEYANILAEKKKLREEFERELNALESELRVAIDPTLLPPIGKGILRWPLESVTITQYFGNTQFAKSGAYNGSGHNGVDFRASVGTPVYAALSGTVLGVGNTDVGSCQSYGRWVLIKHNNGLSTLYAHLSHLPNGISSGEIVTTGDIIGYSGNTGYSTGPHLHFSVYASQGVQVVNIGDWYRQNGKSANTACSLANVSIPVAPLNAYLNPLDYL